MTESKGKLNNTSYKKWLFFTIMAGLVLILCLYLNSNEKENDSNSIDNGLLAVEDSNMVFESSTRSSTRAIDATDPCIECHRDNDVLEAVILDWEASEHAVENVTCIDCHLAKETDPNAVEHFNNYYITTVVSPIDCAKCHPQETMEFNQSLHSFGAEYYEFLFNNKKLPYIESQVEGGYLTAYGEEITHAATLRGCQACHGTNMTDKTTEDFTVWPNNGIGRINPDGSKGSCSSCHSRHAFSIEEARKPETCGQCHMGPDHPQIEMFLESKHGNIYSSEGYKWNWTKDNWQAGVDYRAPTCAGCHMSSAPGVPATHDVSARLSWELESAVSRRTDNIANSLGVKFSDGSSWEVKQGRMKTVCKQCHSKTWVDNYYDQADLAVELYNEQYLSAKVIVDQLYDEGLLTTKGFDEEIEFVIYEMWHHEGRRARMGAFMQAPDYVQWHGFYDLLHDRAEIEQIAHELRSGGEDSNGSLVFLATNGPGTEVMLVWNISHPTEVDHYELYWDTSIINDVSGLSAKATTTDDFFIVENLAKDKIYYFTIVAVDSEGESSAMAFSSAMPSDVAGHDDDDDENDDEHEDDDSVLGLNTTSILLVIAIIILIIAIIVSLGSRKSGNSGDIGAQIKELEFDDNEIDEDLEDEEKSSKPRSSKKGSKTTKTTRKTKSKSTEKNKKN
jgi:formate-dependent nitrite reductase cytochrome c552 subunit